MIKIPTHCPSCGEPLVLINEQLFCKNKYCEAQSLKKLEHFCKSMKIKGMGPATLEKLNFESIKDLYTFSYQYYIDTLGSTIGTKVYNEVHKSKSLPLNYILAGLSIPLIGETASKKICSVISNIKDINEISCKEAGLGEKATSNLLSWTSSDEYSELLTIKLNFNSEEVSSTEKNDIVVCITGKLLDFKNRNDAKNYLESLGYTVVDSVTKNTNILILEEDKQSSKRSKAESLGIEIMTINELINRK